MYVLHQVDREEISDGAFLDVSIDFGKIDHRHVIRNFILLYSKMPSAASFHNVRTDMQMSCFVYVVIFQDIINHSSSAYHT